jgi:DMSO/TMAO reductase YedYZ molybdopterin-dependent catalytic subunit
MRADAASGRPAAEAGPVFAPRDLEPGHARLVTVEERPFNAETPLAALDQPLTPVELFYVRNHFDVPRLDPAATRLTVDGRVEHALELGLDELRRLPSRTIVTALECAGNGRTTMTPRPPGTPWGWGAVSTGSFTGVPLGIVLERARPLPGAVEVAFTGADRGEVAPGRTVAFERSLPLAVALAPDTLLVHEMNGGALTADHGWPLRLVVPGWYGVASVKWLTRVTVLERPLEAFYQTERYVYEGERGTPERTPVTRMRVRSLIARPADGDDLRAGQVEIAGTAWSGGAAIREVAVTTDGGASWGAANLDPAASPYAHVRWTFRWDATPGEHVLASRASDSSGAIQPLDAVWNVHGYGNNVVQRLRVRVSERADGPPRASS